MSKYSIQEITILGAAISSAGKILIMFLMFAGRTGCTFITLGSLHKEKPLDSLADFSKESVLIGGESISSLSSIFSELAKYVILKSSRRIEVFRGDFKTIYRRCNKNFA